MWTGDSVWRVGVWVCGCGLVGTRVRVFGYGEFVLTRRDIYCPLVYFIKQERCRWIARDTMHIVE